MFIPLVLLGVSLALHPNEDHYYFRGMRMMVSLVSFLLIALFAIKKNGLLLAFAVCYSISSLLTLWYELDVFATLSMIVNGVSFIFLGILIFKKLEFRMPDRWFLASWILATLVIGWLMYSFLDILYNYVSSVRLFVAICFSSGIMFLLGVIAFLYNNQQNSRNSIIYVFFHLILAFAEMFRGVGYYDFVDSVSGQYIARFLLIASFTLFLRFSQLELRGTQYL
ncbi:hypothetical protein POV27_19275 [Aureisphaera galaxeae]|uniref:hypothetical protein n=1 Tax=Aureisphaera galaxeae TaxID=1538023 RepID=UPI002350F6CC|nr:hypothetical protein [Aureisphaera galaxeae]MDC8006203.1 hypothetical protein [Aureisphaera galaxeae]